MYDGRWKMDFDGRWKMEDGFDVRRKMEDEILDGRGKMEEGRWKREETPRLSLRIINLVSDFLFAVQELVEIVE